MTSRFKRLPDPLLGAVSGGEGLVMHAPATTAHDWSGALSDGVLNTRPWWEEHVAAGLPALPAPWNIRLIPAGIWLYSGTPPVEAATRVASIPVEPDRMAIAVGVGVPSQAILDAVGALLTVLPPDSPRAVRLLMPLLDMRVAQTFAAQHRVDLVATQGRLTLEPGRVVTSGLDDRWGDGFWQWYRVGPGRSQAPYGALHPQPAWERALTEHGRHPVVPSARIGRVPAGLTLSPLGAPDPRFVKFATGIRPSIDTFKVMVQANGLDPLLMSACTTLLSELPWETVCRTQLIWPYAATEATRQSVRELAEDLGAEITAPAAGLRLGEGDGDVYGVRSNGTLGQWVRFTPGEPDSVEGALLPVPRWNAKLRNRPRALPASLMLARVEAGLYLMRGEAEPEYRALVGTLLPDREAMTVFVEGDATRPEERGSLLSLLDGIDSSLLAGLRLVMRSAADAGSGSFAQMVANRYRARISVATTESVNEAVARAGQSPLDWIPFRPLATAPVPVRTAGATAVNPPLKSVAVAKAPTADAAPTQTSTHTQVVVPITARNSSEAPSGAPALPAVRAVRAVRSLGAAPAAAPTATTSPAATSPVSGTATTSPATTGTATTLTPTTGTSIADVALGVAEFTAGPAAEPAVGPPAEPTAAPVDLADETPAPHVAAPPAEATPSEETVVGHEDLSALLAPPAPIGYLASLGGGSRPAMAGSAGDEPARRPLEDTSPPVPLPPVEREKEPPVWVPLDLEPESDEEPDADREPRTDEEPVRNGQLGPDVEPKSPRAPTAEEALPPTPASVGAPEPGKVPPRPSDTTDSTQELAQAVLEPSAPITLLVRRSDRSTDAERYGWRDLIGPRRDTHLIAVSRVLAQRPALRGALSHEPLDGVTTDLAALRSYLEGDLPDIEVALRERNPQMKDAAVCVVSGLRVLPVHSGIVYRTAELPAAALDAYTPGATVVEPGFLGATSRKAAYGGNVLYAIWCRTGRRTAVLGSSGSRDEVLFPAGAEFTVLAVEPWSDGAGRLVLLSEQMPGVRPAESRADNATGLLDRMRTSATSLAVGSQDLSEAPDRHRLPVGLDDRHQAIRLN
ncbi:hypothetical protein [Streptomyces sp. NPDC000410]|uniref:hypothetical protein n=1 Tax=Streptomyces sp. NPDC000410 TaxID=3154254 RepID=UPI003316B926